MTFTLRDCQRRLSSSGGTPLTSSGRSVACRDSNGATAHSPKGWASSLASRRTVNVGIIGSGYMGSTYAECLARYNRNAGLVAIAGGSRSAP